ncbi:asparagine synthase (glutamine-hydrolyzing) [Caldanaerobius fijiensis DSM 17918]|uniref:asparagine synthase (glutamine-hydrolyzing) n=1 Tax=Caldanaerobius fijiensis DSM 17918 TaxID=1121256 RepID=A0A1M4Y1H1_9THEO|nr:asparagine synthase-related protein [Caldanaerobius fijiensis]SHE99591.1 asparagine synthase (glutamine-hydrolyzing) [Caldanaerobius fijiensis DSM 17918]
MNEIVGILNRKDIAKNLELNNIIYKWVNDKSIQLILSEKLNSEKSAIFYKEIKQNNVNMISVHREDNYLIVGNGQVNNINEIARKVNKINITNVNEVLLLAYKKFGIDFVKEINGEFVFIIWDGNKKQLICVRDSIGIKSLFYSIYNNVVVLATNLSNILKYNLVRSDLDDVYFSEYLTFGLFEQHLTPYKNIKRLMPGSILIINDENAKLVNYWNISNIKKVNYKNEDDYFEHFKSLLMESVYRNFNISNNVLIELSGGLDSSSIVCLVRELVEKRRDLKNKINTFTIDYGSLLVEEDDMPFAKSVINSNPNFNPIIVDGREFWFLKNLGQIEGEDKLFYDEPNMNILIHDQNKFMLNIIEKYNIDTIISGEGGDHLLSWNNYYLADYLRQGSLIKVLIESLKWSRQLKCPVFKVIKENCLLPILKRNVCLFNSTVPPWVSKKLIMFTNLNERIEKYYRTIKVDTITDSYQISIMNNIHEILDGNVFAKLVEIKYPFLYLPLIEFIFGIPIDKKIRAGELNKYILRYSLKGILPEDVLNRKNKAGGERRFYIGLKKEWPWLEQIINNSIIINELKFIDKEKFLQILNYAKQGYVKDPYLFSIGRTLSAEIWLRYFKN